MMSCVLAGAEGLIRLRYPELADTTAVVADFDRYTRFYLAVSRTASTRQRAPRHAVLEQIEVSKITCRALPMPRLSCKFGVKCGYINYEDEHRTYAERILKEMYPDCSQEQIDAVYKHIVSELDAIKDILPTAYQSPDEFLLLHDLFQRISDQANKVLNPSRVTFPHKLTYGTIRMGEFSAFVESGIRDRDYLIVISDGLFTFFEEEMNKNLFTDDGWINTGDVAVRYSNGKYRIFGRGTDYFVNTGISYAMYDIEEQVLKHPDVVEAEVIKFEVDGEEYPAMVVVLSSNATDRIAEITKEICSIDVAGMEYFIGVRFVDKFKTHPVTSKRDYLSLQNDKNGYYFVDKNGNAFVSNVGKEKQAINTTDIMVINV